MLSKEELRLLNEILKDLSLEGDKELLQKKIALIIEQLNIMEENQEKVAKIQDEIQKLSGDNNEEKEN